MKNLIACCGLNCKECDAYAATIKNNNKLREEIAERWRLQYEVTEISAEMINCTGCREEGVKIGHCAECEMRNCVQKRGYETCADCLEMNNCTIIEGLHKSVPKAKENLLYLRTQQRIK